MKVFVEMEVSNFLASLASFRRSLWYSQNNI